MIATAIAIAVGALFAAASGSSSSSQHSGTTELKHPGRRDGPDLPPRPTPLPQPAPPRRPVDPPLAPAVVPATTLAFFGFSVVGLLASAGVVSLLVCIVAAVAVLAGSLHAGRTIRGTQWAEQKERIAQEWGEYRRALQRWEEDRDTALGAWEAEVSARQRVWTASQALAQRRREGEERRLAHEQEAAAAHEAREERRRRRARRAAEEADRQALAAAAAAAERRARFNTARDAIIWTRHFAPQLEIYVQAHWAEIVRDRDGAMRRFHDPDSLIGTANKSRELAAWFISEHSLEAAHLLSPSQRNAEVIARMLRAFHGREVELMLPKAMAIACQRLIAADNAPASAEPTEPDDPLASFSPDDRRALRESLRDIENFQALDALLDRQYAAYEEHLRRRQPPLTEEQIAIELEKYRANQGKLKEDWAASKDLVA